jgi:hypothetical protein
MQMMRSIDKIKVHFEGKKACKYQGFWLDDLQCTGDEKRLRDCGHAAWGKTNCKWQSECVQLYCSNGGPERPTGKVVQNSATGVLSIKYKEETRGICDNKFTAVEAGTVCKELYGDAKVISFKTSEECEFKDFWISDLACVGNEELLSDCQHSEYGKASGACQSKTSCVKIYCEAGGPQPTLFTPVHDAKAGQINLSYKN